MSRATTHLIIDGFKEQSLSFKHITHPTIPTSSLQASQIRNTPLENGAKALILKGKSSAMYQFVIPANHRLDLKQVKIITGEKNISLSSPDLVFELTDCEIGSVPPCGNLWNIPVFIDNELFSREWIVFSAGTHTDSVQCSPESLASFTNASRCDCIRKP